VRARMPLCSDNSWENYAPRYQQAESGRARPMVQLLSSINQTSGGGRQVVTLLQVPSRQQTPESDASCAALYGPTS